VTQRALLRDLLVGLPRVERLGTPVGVAAGGCATLERVSGTGLDVRIMAHAARLAVGVARRIEVREHGPHRVAAEALVGTRSQRSRRRIARRQERHVGGELMAGDAV
jgi:hypothetical protein